MSYVVDLLRGDHDVIQSSGDGYITITLFFIVHAVIMACVRCRYEHLEIAEPSCGRDNNVNRGSNTNKESKHTTNLSYVADPPRGFASCHLEKVMKRQWGSRRDTTTNDIRLLCSLFLFVIGRIGVT